MEIKYTDFEEFINKNRLKKKDVAEYLGVSSAFITALCSGSRPIPIDKYDLIKSNPNWDTSMLSHNRNVILSGDNNSIISTDGHHNHSIVNNINPSGNEKIINPSGEITIEPIRPGEIPVDIKIEIESLRQEIDDLKKIKYDLLRENAELRGANISLEKMNESLLNRLSKR